MRAITVLPGEKDSARLETVADPSIDDGPVLVQTIVIGTAK
jgi:hypothetical protein